MVVGMVDLNASTRAPALVQGAPGIFYDSLKKQFSPSCLVTNMSDALAQDGTKGDLDKLVLEDDGVYDPFDVIGCLALDDFSHLSNHGRLANDG